MTIATIAVALALQSSPSYKIGGDTVPVLIPTWKSPRPLDVYEFEGFKYGFRDGQLVAKAKTGFEWSDVPAAPSGSAELKQNVLINVVTRIDTVTNRGFLLQRQASIYNDDFRAIKREVALFCHLVKALTNGKTDIEPTWRLDDTLRFVDKAEDLGRNYLETFLNATSKKPAEGLGPFDSVLVLTPSFSRRMTASRFDGSPVANVPVYGYFDNERPGQLARALYNAWLSAPTGAALTQADPIGSGPLPLFEASDWINAAWQQLPTVAVTSTSVVLGASVREDSTMYVRPEFAALYAAKLGRSPSRQSHAWVGFENVTRAGATDIEVLGVQPQPAAQDAPSTELPFTPGQAEQLPISGSFAIKTSADPDRGSVGELKEMSIRRQGWIRLLGSFDGATNGGLELWLKPRGTAWPLDLVFEGDGTTKVFRLFGYGPDALPDSARQPHFDVQHLILKDEATWQRVAVNHGLSKVTGVYLATPPTSEEWLRPSLPSVFLDDVAAKPSVTDLTPFERGVRVPDPDVERARTAATTKDETLLIKLLSDPSDTVRLNAAHRFTEIKNALAVPALTVVASNYNPRLAQNGARALAYQGTEAALGALRYNYQTSLGDYVKQFTADVLPAIDERKILSELALALNARRPEARAAAARALARQPFKEATLVMLAFLNDIEPVVRAATIEALPEKQSTALARVIGYARNDASDLVRAAAFRKLKEWGSPEAAEVSKDPSPRVRGD